MSRRNSEEGSITAKVAPLLDADIERMEEMIALNTIALTRLTYAAAPAFVKRGTGTIINIGSAAGISVEALNGVYGASKAYVLAFSLSLQHELTSKGIRGRFLQKALHHQHARVYNFDRTTEYEVFESPCQDMTMKFLDLVHYDQGGRIFTYVLTLDSLFCFTETGKEFGIDLLSKHTMHSDVSIYIAFSGEFFIRRLEHPHRAPPEGGKNASYRPDGISGGPPEDDTPKDPAYYELVIDNDSGTYRPNASLLPQLKSFFESNFPGLHIKTLDCQGDAELMNQMKQEQRDKKGDHIIYTQLLRKSSSLGSSDEEALDELEAEGEPRDSRLVPNLKREAAAKQKAKKTHLKEYKPGNNRDAWKEKAGEGAGDGARDAPQVEQQ